MLPTHFSLAARAHETSYSPCRICQQHSKVTQGRKNSTTKQACWRKKVLCWIGAVPRHLPPSHSHPLSSPWSLRNCQVSSYVPTSTPLPAWQRGSGGGRRGVRDKTRLVGSSFRAGQGMANWRHSGHCRSGSSCCVWAVFTRVTPLQQSTCLLGRRRTAGACWHLQRGRHAGSFIGPLLGLAPLLPPHKLKTLTLRSYCHLPIPHTTQPSAHLAAHGASTPLRAAAAPPPPPQSPPPPEQCGRPAG